jgi:hypothetical protein
VVARRGKEKGAMQWNRRLGGVVLCAFFCLGVLTGLSSPGRVLALRIAASLNTEQARILAAILPVRPAPERGLATLANPAMGGAAVALVERDDGFYALDARGELSGPVALNAAGDLPVLSGPVVAGAPARQLVGYAAILVRAEAELSELVSEMRPGPENRATLFLDRWRTEVIVDLDGAPLELRHAGEVLGRWRGREKLIAALDMTTPGEAVMRLSRPAKAASKNEGRVQRVAERFSTVSHDRWKALTGGAVRR